MYTLKNAHLCIRFFVHISFSFRKNFSFFTESLRDVQVQCLRIRVEKRCFLLRSERTATAGATICRYSELKLHKVPRISKIKIVNITFFFFKLEKSGTSPCRPFYRYRVTVQSDHRPDLRETRKTVKITRVDRVGFRVRFSAFSLLNCFSTFRNCSVRPI